jgi:hypothetical protein
LLLPCFVIVALWFVFVGCSIVRHAMPSSISASFSCLL